MKTFILLRVDDVSGSSGTGRVAEGMVSSDGRVAMFFADSIKIFNSVDKMMEVHSHGGRTRLHYTIPKGSTAPMAREWKPTPLPQVEGLYLLRNQADPVVVRVRQDETGWRVHRRDGETDPMFEPVGEWTPLHL